MRGTTVSVAPGLSSRPKTKEAETVSKTKLCHFYKVARKFQTCVSVKTLRHTPQWTIITNDGVCDCMGESGGIHSHARNFSPTSQLSIRK